MVLNINESRVCARRIHDFLAEKEQGNRPGNPKIAGRISRSLRPNLAPAGGSGFARDFKDV
jgi:hypothetical protein